MANLARQVIGLLDVLGIGRFTVYGCSSGGQVALSLAADHADRVRNAVVHEVAMGERPASHPCGSVLRQHRRRAPAGIDIGLLPSRHFPQVSIPHILSQHIREATDSLTSAELRTPPKGVPLRVSPPEGGRRQHPQGRRESSMVRRHIERLSRQSWLPVIRGAEGPAAESTRSICSIERNTALTEGAPRTLDRRQT
jgi:pimeloyl-ACP methyl ester carboxylesterase